VAVRDSASIFIQTNVRMLIGRLKTGDENQKNLLNIHIRKIGVNVLKALIDPAIIHKHKITLNMSLSMILQNENSK
jgi:hypothetical protein